MIREYTLNETPIRTTNGYKMNNIKLDIDLPDINEFGNIDIISDELDKFSILVEKECKNSFKSRIGLDFDKYYKIKFIIPKNVVINKPIIIKYKFDKYNSNLINKIYINLEENSKADFILKYECVDEKVKAFYHLKQITNASKNSKTKITIVNLLNEISDSFIAVENEVDKDAEVIHNIIDLGGKNKISNYYSNLEGESGKNLVNNLYFGKNTDVIDMNYYIEIKGEKAEANIEFQGAIKDYAKKSFKGTIDFIKGCTKSIGKENENCVILSKTAKSKSLPMLLCHEDDVNGEHGVSSGKIDKEKLFYIMSKGISEKEAEKLIIKANFNKIINNINDEKIKNEIINIIENKI